MTESPPLRSYFGESTRREAVTRAGETGALVAVSPRRGAESIIQSALSEPPGIHSLQSLNPDLKTLVTEYLNNLFINETEAQFCKAQIEASLNSGCIVLDEDIDQRIERINSSGDSIHQIIPQLLDNQDTDAKRKFNKNTLRALLESELSKRITEGQNLTISNKEKENQVNSLFNIFSDDTSLVTDGVWGLSKRLIEIEAYIKKHIEKLKELQSGVSEDIEESRDRHGLQLLVQFSNSISDLLMAFRSGKLKNPKDLSKSLKSCEIFDRYIQNLQELKRLLKISDNFNCRAKFRNGKKDFFITARGLDRFIELTLKRINALPSQDELNKEFCHGKDARLDYVLALDKLREIARKAKPGLENILSI